MEKFKTSSPTTKDDGILGYMVHVKNTVTVTRGAI